MIEDIEKLLAEIGPVIEREMEKFIPRNGTRNLNDAIWYHLDTGGKRLRPALAIISCRAFGGDEKKAVPFAAACEIIHNWILIHDDIEDGDEIRRDKETVWKKFGMPHGINVGDYMSEKVYEIILKTDIKDKIKLRLFEEAVKTCTNTAIGQTLDLNLRESNNPTEEEYMKSVEMKTAFYLTMPIVGGALIAGADDKTIKKIRDFGMKIGPAFQIADDVLDLTEGKGRGEIGSDIKEGKRSIIVVHCASRCTAEEKERLFEILNKPRASTTMDDVLWVKSLFEKYGSVDYAVKRASTLIDESKTIIKDMPEKQRKILSDFADYMVKRKR